MDPIAIAISIGVPWAMSHVAPWFAKTTTGVTGWKAALAQAGGAAVGAAASAVLGGYDPATVATGAAVAMGASQVSWTAWKHRR